MGLMIRMTIKPYIKTTISDMQSEKTGDDYFKEDGYIGSSLHGGTCKCSDKPDDCHRI